MRFQCGLFFILALGQAPISIVFAADKDVYHIEQQVKMDELADACARLNRPDQICQAIVQARQIGDDAIEAAKEFLRLTPREYAVLTALNAAAQGRIRIRTRMPFFKDTNATLDLQRNETRFVIDKSF